MQGRSFGPLLTAPNSYEGRDTVFSETQDPWELHNVADEPRYAKQVRALAGALQTWITSKIPPLRNTELPPAKERWGRQGPT
jgi:hypothetical protein